MVDSLQGVGAIRCATVSDAKATAGWETSSLQGKQQLVLGSGAGRSGALVILQRSISPEVITEVPLPGKLQLTQPVLKEAIRSMLQNASLNVNLPLYSLHHSQCAGAVFNFRIRHGNNVYAFLLLPR